MATTNTTTASHGDPAASSCRTSILFDARAYIGDLPNGTTAEDLTSSNKSIKVSIWPADPPAPSRLYVHCPDLYPDVFLEYPFIVSTADRFLLLRVRIGRPTKWPEKGDYFIYQAGRPSLRLLLKPPTFHDDQIGLLPRGEHFAIASLNLTINGFDLHLFKSESWAWTTFSKVPIVTPQRAFPIQIPVNAARLNQHITTTVIMLGGKDGTMGWVDLWRGILFCDVLSSSPKLRGVPLPLPRSLIYHGKGIEGCPKSYRGIAVVQGCLRMVEMDVHCNGIPTYDPEMGHLNIKIHDWEVSTYTNSRMTGAWEDWQLERTVSASHMGIDEAMRWQLLQSGLLNVAQEGTERKLQNIHTCQPALSLDDNGVVYLLAKVKFMQSKAWVLTVDIKGNKIQGLADFGTDKSLGLSVAYRPSTISSYINVSAIPVLGGNLRCLMNQSQQADDGNQVQHKDDAVNV